MGKNDQVVPTVPGTNVGGHDTSGADGEKRTERAGEILGTPDAEPPKYVTDARERETARADYVQQAVDKANREELPKLGGDVTEPHWEPDKAAKESPKP